MSSKKKDKKKLFIRNIIQDKKKFTNTNFQTLEWQLQCGFFFYTNLKRNFIFFWSTMGKLTFQIYVTPVIMMKLVTGKIFTSVIFAFAFL